MKRTFRQGSSLLVALALLVACSSDDDSDDAGDTATTAAGDTATTAADDTATTEGDSSATTDSGEGGSGSAEGITVAFIPHFRTPFTEIMIDGAEAAVAEFPGAELVVAGPTSFDAPAAVAAAEDAVAAGAQGVAVVPFPSEVWNRPLQDLLDDGLAVATLNVPALDSGVPLYSGVNEFDIGRAIADIAIDALGENPSGQVVLGNCAPGVQVLTDRIEGFNAQVAERAPDLQVDEAVDVLAEPTANLGAWEALIAANSDAVAFAGFCAFDTPNLVRAKEQTGGDFVIAGGDLEPDTMAGIADGSLTASASQSPFMQGYIAVRAILENLVNGTPMPEGWIDAGIEIVDAETIEEVEAREGDPALMLEWYQPQIDEIFADPAAVVRPLEDLRG